MNLLLAQHYWHIPRSFQLTRNDAPYHAAFTDGEDLVTFAGMHWWGDTELVIATLP